MEALTFHMLKAILQRAKDDVHQQCLLELAERQCFLISKAIFSESQGAAVHEVPIKNTVPC